MMRREILQIRLPEKWFNLEHSLNRSSSLLDDKDLVYECCVCTHKDVILRLVGDVWEPTAVVFPSSLPLQSCPHSACHFSCSRACYCWAIFFFHGSCGRFLPVSFQCTVIWLRADWFCLFPFGIWKDALTVELDYTWAELQMFKKHSENDCPTSGINISRDEECKQHPHPQ